MLEAGLRLEVWQAQKLLLLGWMLFSENLAETQLEEN